MRVGYIAVNENGLIGRVVSVGRRSSRVLMLDDYNSRIPVMGEASRVRAVLAGQATQPPDLITRPFELQAPRLDFIVGAESLREGERIITSGDGGLYPRGIPVGVARRSRRWRNGVSRLPRASSRSISCASCRSSALERRKSAGRPTRARRSTRSSSVSAIGRDVMAPPPTAPTPQPTPPRPRRERQPPQAAAAPRPRATDSAATGSARRAARAAAGGAAANECALLARRRAATCCARGASRLRWRA